MTEQRTTYWCSRCGSNATYDGPSLDPAHPMVMCLRTGVDGLDRSCGRVPGISDVGEISRVMRHHREERERANHARHLRYGLVASCPRCKAALEAPPGRQYDARAARP